MNDDSLTTTAYVILGQLALRPWTTYALATQMRRDVHFVWPAAESRIYAQVKQLERAGLASSTRTHVGRRPRTTYSITDEGRSHLARWMATRPAETTTESEALLRVFLAPGGTLADLRQAIEAVDDQARSLRAIGEVVANDYLSGNAEFASQIHLRALAFDFLWRQSELLSAWAAAARAEVAQWNDLELTPAKARRARKVFSRS